MPVILHDVRKGKVEVICGQGPAPAAATIAHFRKLGLDMVPGTGLLAACVPGTFDTWMMLLRDYGTMRLAEVLAPAIYYAEHGHPLVERASATIATVEELFRKHWPTSADVYLPDGRRAGDRHAVHQQDAGRDLPAHRARGGKRGRRTREADREGAADLERGLRRRGDRPVLPHPGDHGHLRRAPSRRADRRRHRRLGAAHRGAADLRLRPLHRLQGRRLVAGPGDAAATGAAQGLRSRRRRSDRRRVHPYPGRMLQARLRGPREVLRRSGLRRGADRDAAVRRLQRRAAQARPSHRVARSAARLGRGLRRGGQAQGRRRRSSAAWARANRPSAAWARWSATPCISTSSTRPAT